MCCRPRSSCGRSSDARWRRRRRTEWRTDALLGRLRLVRLDATLLDAAGRLGPPTLRTLDAIHLQCALLLGDELDALVTHDARPAEAARDAGLPVWAPA